MARSRPWQIWIDTGGTFTDCLARDPSGARRRAKVLSCGAVRGRVVEVIRPDRIRVEQSWGGVVPRGFSFELLGGGGAAAVRDHDAGAGILTLDRPLPGADLAGAVFQLATGEEAPLLAARLLTATPPAAPLPPVELRLATTLGTNALLQQRGAPTALFVTRGFGDLLLIGTQQRPELFALAIERPAPLHRAVVEVDERIDAAGEVLRPLDVDGARRAARRLLKEGIRVAAVALVNSYAAPDHEERLAAALREEGLDHVSCSSALSPLISLLTRAETAAVDATLTPRVGGFLSRVAAAVAPRGGLSPEAGESPLASGAAAPPLLVMTSAGGLVRHDSFRAKDSLLSGPAGGVVGAAAAGRASGFSKVISFDMGGTSTDVARFDGDFDYSREQRVGQARLATPALAIETVAAGGGSICGCDHGALRVGPESAGADPGPACYGAGGPLTLTDVNLLLGRLDARRFGIPVHPGLSRRALDRVRRALRDQAGHDIEPEALLEGFVQLADERMADAIRRVSLRRGYEPADHALVAFGGAGPQHACGVAERLGMTTVVVPPDAGLLSAVGLGRAVVEKITQRQVLRRLDEVSAELGAWFSELGARARAQVAADGIPADRIEVRRQLAHLRLAGQDSTLAVEVAAGAGADLSTPLQEGFERRFVEIFGHRPEGRPMEVESLQVFASSAADAGGPAEPARADPAAARSDDVIRAYLGGAWRETPCYSSEALEPGARIAAPAVVMSRHSTTLVSPGWRGRVDAAGALRLDRVRAASGRGGGRGPIARPGHAAVELELFVGRLTAVAEEMGELLQRVALSTNIKERQDYSCAVLDAAGELVVNAPHQPVHLGSLGLCVRRVARALPLEPGDVAVTNHPAFGGSHLPDITVVTPVHQGGELIGYMASRAHHAEIGGASPGSMPPSASTLAEEGVVIPPFKAVERGVQRWAALRRTLTSGPFPSRAPDDNIADLRAGVAANHLGAMALSRLARRRGAGAVRRCMAALRRRATRRLERALAGVPDGRYEARSELDDGWPLQVSIEVAGARARVSFAGTGGVHPGNLNATPAVVRGAVIYVLRLLIRQPMPLNEGLMSAVDLDIPPGLLDPDFTGAPWESPAVVGGNVETSQRLVDLMLRALGLAACSQGTMNNTLFGSAAFGYYETVGGGAGAGPTFRGASGVHTHMTNTRITDVEVLEHRYPVRVERFAIRAGSGGAGQNPGGDGLVRELRFLEPMTLSLLSQRRVRGPCGLDGGAAGAPGRQTLIRANGEEERLASIDGREVGPGDRLLLETPGGGGWGDPGRQRTSA